MTRRIPLYPGVDVVGPVHPQNPTQIPYNDPFAPYGLGSGAAGTQQSGGFSRAYPYPDPMYREQYQPAEPYEPAPVTDTETVDLQGADLVAFMEQLRLQFSRAEEDRRPLVTQANLDESRYNLIKYLPDELPLEGATSFRIPAARSRVDRASAEIGSAFDRDGSPVFAATPLTPSMTSLAPHVEAFFHNRITDANGVNHYRNAIHYSFKTGTAFLVSEVVARRVTGINRGFESFGQPNEEEYENALVIRAVKVQDMYILPVGLSDLRKAGFVGERFQMPRWEFNDMQAAGFYAVPLDENAQVIPINNGTDEQDHGQSESMRRLGLTAGNHADSDPAGMVDLVRAWVRFQKPSKVAEGDRRSELYYVVFPRKNPRAILRLKINPYTLLDHSPYVPMPTGMSTELIYGESWMKLLAGLNHLLDTLHMLHVEAQKRAYSRFYLIRSGSELADTLMQRRDRSIASAPGPLIEGRTATNGPQTLARIMPDEYFETDDPTGDVKDFSFANTNPGFMYDEGRIIQYMNAATVDDMPMGGSVRSVFELNQAASQTSAKLKSFLKVYAYYLKQHIEIVRAQLWEYGMQESAISEYVKFMEYGDVEQPVTMTDFFSGVSLDPAGTTTSADQTVAITTTASLIQEMVPLILNVPGLVPDPVKAIREFVKARAAALGYQKWEQAFGLTEPTEGDVQKGAMYLALVKSLTAQGGGGVADQMPTSLSATGGAVQGPPSMGASMGMSNAGDNQGGSAMGVTPQMQQMMGAPSGENAG